MPNVNAPFGARPAERIRAIHTYSKGTAATQIIYPGDFVALNSSGKAVLAAAGGTQLLGVALGYQVAADLTVTVADDPEQEYYIQGNGAGVTPLAATSIGNNFDLVATVGSTTFLKSKHTLNETDASGSGAANLRLLGYHPDDLVEKLARCRVVINEHAFGKTTTGV